MPLGLTDSQWRQFVRLDPEHQRDLIASMSATDALNFDADFEAWAHENQWPPSSEGWRVWLMMAGRGYGKTRAGSEWVYRLAMAAGRRIALVAGSIEEGRKVMIEGVSGLIAISRNYGVRPTWEPSLNQLRWPGGSIATLYSGDNPDGLRGPEHHVAWCDELAKWRRPEESWDNLQLGLRLGPRARALVTTTPRTIPLLNIIRALPWTVETGGRTKDNVSLSKTFVDVMTATYGGTRVGRQELDGELLSEAEGSLSPREMVDRARVEVPAKFDRVVVGVDLRLPCAVPLQAKTLPAVRWSWSKGATKGWQPARTVSETLPIFAVNRIFPAMIC